MQLTQASFGFPEMIMAFLFALLALVQPVEAQTKDKKPFSGGDYVALFVGLILGTLGICACIGKYARGRA